MKSPGSPVKLAVTAVLFACSACRSSAPEEPARGVRSEIGLVPVAAATPSATPRRAVAKIPPGEAVTRFAVIGDFGAATDAAAKVAELVRNERPDFVITTGDNNYPDGEAATIDPNIGRFYHEFIHPYVGRYGLGAKDNRFFPSLGNHDWETPGAKPYLDYFTLPGNERYYDFVRGDVHFFAIDSDEREPDGIQASSKQAAWLERALGASKSAWQIVYMHHPPYSSGSHGSSVALRWPYARWGADLVLAGHDHHYERLEQDDIVYVVNGLGGNRAYPVRRALPGSIFSYNKRHGAQIVEASQSTLVSRFFSIDREAIDEFSLRAKKPAP